MHRFCVCLSVHLPFFLSDTSEQCKNTAGRYIISLDTFFAVGYFFASEQTKKAKSSYAKDS